MTHPLDPLHPAKLHVVPVRGKWKLEHQFILVHPDPITELRFDTREAAEAAMEEHERNRT